MPTIFIDGEQIEAKEGQTIIEAALEHSINVPHFCWHPSLTVAGNCRMCLVNIGFPSRNPDDVDENGDRKIQYQPKAAIACATPVADGMHVNLTGKKSVEAQEAVMEFLLINHPLDCPICDEAGQCKLQEYAFNHSKGKSRFDEQKNHKDKRVQWGPTIMFDGERCISCSRCIRYADEIAKQPVLTFVQRGDHVTIQTFENTQFDSPYSMNVIELCPVGALTSIDFRFKTRVWEMSFTDSVCPGCSRGCNMQIGVRDNTIVRLEPKTNMEVNEYWMCDYGRLTQYDGVNNNRVIEPMVRKNGSLVAVSWDEAIAEAVKLISGVPSKDISLVASASSTNEDLFALQKFASLLNTSSIEYISNIDPSFGDDFLKQSDKSYNSFGINALPLKAKASTADKFSVKNTPLLITTDDSLSVDAVSGANAIIAFASNKTAIVEKANVVLPLSTYAEVEGTVTNFQNRVQHIEPAVATVENQRFMGMKQSRWDAMGAHNDRWTQGEKRNSRSGWSILQSLASELGQDWNYKQSSDVFAEIASSNAGFSLMNYAQLDEFQGLIVGASSLPEKKAIVYQSHVMKPN